MIDRMLGHPAGNADLALDHAALKRDVAQVAVRDDLFDTFSGFCRQDMTENRHKRHEHQTLLSPATPTSKTQAGHGEFLPWTAAAILRLRRTLRRNSCS